MMKWNPVNTRRKNHRCMAWFLCIIICICATSSASFAEMNNESQPDDRDISIITTEEISVRTLEDENRKALELQQEAEAEQVDTNAQNHPEEITGDENTIGTITNGENGARGNTENNGLEANEQTFQETEAEYILPQNQILENNSEYGEQFKGILAPDEGIQDETNLKIDGDSGQNVQAITGGESRQQNAVSNSAEQSGDEENIDVINEETNQNKSLISDALRDFNIGGTSVAAGDGENYDLLDNYAVKQLQEAIPQKKMLRASRLVGGNLPEAARFVYYALKEVIAQTAAGNRASTAYTIDVSELNLIWKPADLGYTSFSGSNISEATQKGLEAVSLNPSDQLLNALLADCPYELYWFNKTAGMAWTADGGWGSDYVHVTAIQYSFAVADEFSAGSYKMNTAYADSINRAVQTAKNIVSSAAALADVEKLRSYSRQICAYVSYNYNAASGTSYGNPWQLIWVFDGDESTNVVCEGYAKAFQYLCDLTVFNDNSICCYTPTGTLSSAYGLAGPHMWNIVHMDDGRNYMVDITNCDVGMIGYPDLLFLKEAVSGSVSYGYTFTNAVEYQYDADTFATFTTDDLLISEYVYGSSGHNHIPSAAVRENVMEATLTSTGSYDEVVYCSECGKEISRIKRTVAKLTIIDTPQLTGISTNAQRITITWREVNGAAEYRIYRRTGNSDWIGIADVSASSFTDSNVIAGTVYTYTVRCLNGAGVLVSDFDHSGKSIVASYPYSIPVLKSVACVDMITSGTGQIKLTWEEVEGITQYNIFRKETGKSWTTRIVLSTATPGTKETNGTLSFTDNTLSLQSGISYTYTVRCADENGKSVSDFDSTGISTLYLQRPIVMPFSLSSNGITVKWTSVSGAEGYNVFRMLDGSNKWDFVKTVYGNTVSWTDVNAVSGNKYWYTIRAYKGNVQSGYHYRGLAATFVNTPVLSYTNCLVGGVEMTWNSVPNALKYQVLRKTSGGSWSVIGNNLTGTYYKDTSVKSGTGYVYAVRAIAGDGFSLSPLSNQISQAWYTAPSVTSIIASGINTNNTAVTVRWNAIDGVTKYRIWRRAAGEGFKPIADVTGTVYTDRTATLKNNAYRYTVRCLTNDGRIQTSGYLMGLVISVNNGQLASPEITSIVSSNGNVTLRWNCVIGAEKYRVFRMLGSTWDPIADVTGSSYVDRTAQIGKKYRYTVRCINADGRQYTSSYNNGLTIIVK